jgi:hypothetical protein
MSERGAARVDVRPTPIKLALKLNRAWHRRLPVLQGAMWSVRALVGGDVVGVAIVGHPQARMSDDGETLEVLRVAVRAGARNACSALYGSCARAARAMGAQQLFTYTHSDESGHSLRAAGWIEVHETSGGEWARHGRPRQQALDPLAKKRWEPAWSRAAIALREVALRAMSVRTIVYAPRELSDDACMHQAQAWVEYSGKDGAPLTFDEWARSKDLSDGDRLAVQERVAYILMRGKVTYATSGEAA